jgi:hypothetical protein
MPVETITADASIEAPECAGDNHDAIDDADQRGGDSVCCT